MDYNTSLPMKKVPRISNQFPPKKTIFSPRMFRYFLLTSFPRILMVSTLILPKSVKQEVKLHAETHVSNILI